MIAEIGRLRDDPGEFTDYDFAFYPADSGEDCILLTSVHFTGAMTYGGTAFLLKGKLSANVQLPCSRCLTPVEEKLDIDIDEEFDEQEYPDEDAVIDLEDIASQIWITSIPMQVLCREDCKGLCPLCGKNLNEGECDCLTDDIDPRLEILRNLIKPED